MRPDLAQLLLFTVGKTDAGERERFAKNTGQVRASSWTGTWVSLLQVLISQELKNESHGHKRMKQKFI